jgi:hypothetical protein
MALIDVEKVHARIAQEGVGPLTCGSAWKKDPVSGVIGVEQGPLIPMV